MPWLSEAKKDVTSCDKPRQEANTHRSADFRMGQPAAWQHAAHYQVVSEPGELKHLITRRKREQKLLRK